MIRYHVDAVLRVLDGFTGKPLAPSSLGFRVDGNPIRPIAKDGGYFVFLGLGQGDHELCLRHPWFREERLIVTGGSRQELLLTMKPAERYPFGRAITRLRLDLGLQGQGRQIWIAPKDPLFSLRVAQDTLDAGVQEGRLFFPESLRSLSLPRDLLLVDGDKSEICRLEELEPAWFAAPLAHSHRRSTSLYPAQVYRADQQGLVCAVFREPLALEVLYEKQIYTLELVQGDNTVSLESR